MCFMHANFFLMFFVVSKYLLLLGLSDVVLHLQLKKFSLSFAKLVGSDRWRRICHPRIGFLRKILLSRIDESCLSPKETDPGRARWSS